MTAPIATHHYKGRRGMTEYAQESVVMAQNGYTQVSQITTPGRRSAAAQLFVLLGILTLVAGLLFFPLWALAVVFLAIGVLSGKTDDETTVIWRGDAATPTVT